MNRTLPETGRGGWLPALLALLWLNLLLTLSASPEPPWVRPVAAVSPDVLVLLVLGVLLPASLLTLPRWFRGVLVSAIFVAASARIAGLIARELLGRPLDPAGDLPHLGNVAEMLGTVAPRWTVALAIPLAALLLTVLVAISWRALASLAAQRQRLSGRGRVGIALAAGALLLLPGLSLPGLSLPGLSPPGGSAVWSALRIASAPVIDRAAPLTEPPLPAAPDLGGADFYVIFVESYGVAAFEDAEHGPRLREATERWAADAEAAGFDFRSAQIQSPTFGGGSWRAHASLLSGVWLDREARYEALVNSDRVSLVRLFAQAGYRTVAFEPGIQGAWPEGDWYGFDQIYDREAIGYRGPPMGWWEVPDQFTLYALHQQEIRTAARPLFAKVSLIMSHIPYWPVPPYVSPWSRFDAGTAYEGPLRSVAHDDYRDLAELSERYAASLEYQFRILGGFLREFAPRRALVAVIGDHQPPKLSLHDSDTWATPIHLFSRDPSLLVPFERLGFSRTLVPAAGTSWRMSDFPRDLPELFPGRAPARVAP